MEWDLGVEGLALLALISGGFGLAGGVLVGGGWAHRCLGAAVTAVACFVAGLLTSEWVFGRATEQDLQPNVDGLSRDEVLASSLLVLVVVVAVMRLRLRLRHPRHRPRHAA